MTGELYINGQDAFTTWGISLEDGAISNLMTPTATKDYVENQSRLEHGKRVTVIFTKMDSRELTLEMHLVAKTKDEFFQKYQKFCEDVLQNGIVNIKTTYQSDVVYKCLYKSCTQFGQYQFGMAKFALKLTEPNPMDRTE